MMMRMAARVLASELLFWIIEGAPDRGEAEGSFAGPRRSARTAHLIP